MLLLSLTRRASPPQHTVFVHSVPELTPGKHNEARRFVTLVDELYEHGTRLHMAAAADPFRLFAPLMVDPSQQEDHAFGGALWYSIDTSLLSGKVEDLALRELQFASRRAVSRLVEMCGIDVPETPPVE